MAEFTLVAAIVIVSQSCNINFKPNISSLILSFLPANWNDNSVFPHVTVVPAVSIEQTELVVFMSVYEGAHPSVAFFIIFTVAWLLAEEASIEQPSLSIIIGVKFVLPAYVGFTLTVKREFSVVIVDFVIVPEPNCG